ncbi:hypothetical protein AABD69_09165 [Edwardsiella piscicida]|uniref:hypothetical protein n=1 Tax=Edwardsiella piscicida TaxID=1263550 RepID=UPI000D512C61|nr:hypothetical protein [Edwardsiella piscicida]UCQ36420.1 hypothetical protein DCF36_09175 [Edwardsiella piscicida]
MNNSEVNMDLSKLETSLEASAKELISVLDGKIEDLRKASVMDLLKARCNTFEHLPEDVRAAAIHVYATALSNIERPTNETEIEMQKKQLEMLASNIVAGFAKLTSC